MIRKQAKKDATRTASEFTRAYTFRDPFRLQIMCRPNCCLFCDECTDIYYDSGGPYAIICLKQGDFETGMLGKCKMFSEEHESGEVE